MRPRFVLLADRAEPVEGTGGKFDIYGAGISHVVLPELPGVAPNITMVGTFLLEEDDFDRSHKLDASITRREDGESLPGLDAEMDAALFQRRDEFQPVTVVINFAAVRFDRYGPYDVTLIVDGQELATLPLFVRADMPGNGAP